MDPELHNEGGRADVVPAPFRGFSKNCVVLHKTLVIAGYFSIL